MEISEHNKKNKGFCLDIVHEQVGIGFEKNSRKISTSQEEIVTKTKDDVK